MICSIHQPQSFPWLGFFAKIYVSDVFILLDNVQFKKNEFQNRNKIKLNGEARWLTVPVKYKFGQLINEVAINNQEKWKKKHLKTLQNFYCKCDYFDQYFPEIHRLYQEEYSLLIDFNIKIILWALEQLKITTKVVIASDLTDHFTSVSATEKLIQLIKKASCQTYLSGAGGKNYLNVTQMNQEGINVIYQHFQHPEYNQQGNHFIPCLSFLDLLFNEGPKSLQIITKGIQ